MHKEEKVQKVCNNCLFYDFSDYRCEVTESKCKPTNSCDGFQSIGDLYDFFEGIEPLDETA